MEPYGVDSVLVVAVDEESEKPLERRSFSQLRSISSSTFSTWKGLESPSLVGGRDGKLDSPMAGAFWAAFLGLVLAPSLGVVCLLVMSLLFRRLDVLPPLCWLFFDLVVALAPLLLLLLLPLLFDRFFLELLLPPFLELN
jgi:hypothetical protein